MKEPFLSILLTALLALQACSHDNGNADAGREDACDGQDGGDAGADTDPGPPFQLVFASGAQACARFVEQRSAAQELALCCRLSFRPGTVELPRDAERIDADVIERAEMGGPEPEEALPAGPGWIEHEIETALWGWCHRYTLSQELVFGEPSRPLRIEGRFEFCSKNGDLDPERLDFDADLVGESPRGLQEAKHQVDLRGYADQGEDYFTEKLFFRSCTYDLPGMATARISFSLQDGSGSVALDKRFQQPLMGTGEAAAVRAEIALDGEQRSVDDYFEIGYGCDLHNYNERFLLVLDPPIGAVHGLHWQESQVADPPAQLDLLDEALDPAAPIEQRTVIDYSEQAI
ncbi:MAG: hypothetical protein JXR96_01375 [Deltaproteobacteria bacterium]|nr:hypothetical protein [Deltaproteobacteria bacterium]